MGTPPLPVNADPVPPELIDDIRAHLAFSGARAADGELVVRIFKHNGKARKWKIQNDENRSPEK
jgi:hypothetical protein